MWKKAALLTPLLFSSIAQAITVGELVNPGEEFLDCSNLSWYESEVCNEVQNQVNIALANNKFHLNAGNLIYSKSPFTEIGNIEGSACHNTRTEIKSSSASFTLKSSGEINISGNTISSPMIIYTSLPANLYARVDFRTDWWGGGELACTRLGQDNYWADLDVDLNAYSRLFVSLEPKLTKMSNGDYQIKIKPIATIKLAFEDVEADFDFHGVSPLTIAVTALRNGFSSLFNSAEALFNTDFDLFQDEVTDAFVYILGAPLAIPFQQVALMYAENVVQDTANDVIYGNANNQENQLNVLLNNQIKSALNLDENGERTFVVEKQIVDGKLMSALIPALAIL